MRRNPIGNKRVTGGDVTDLIERVKVDFLGHFEVHEYHGPSSEKERIGWSHSFLGDGNMTIFTKMNPSLEEVYRVMQDVNEEPLSPIEILSRVLEENKLFLARANFTYKLIKFNYGNNPHSFQLGFGDLYQLKTAQEI